MMNNTLELPVHRTSTDFVFDTLHDEIATLKLLPGTKISEAEVASRMGVSRQPVRDAFNRLGNLGLLLIRPQRATKIRGFSIAEIENARFVRQAIELEVITRAAAVWDDAAARALEHCMAEQQAALSENDLDQFHMLDYRFHRLICEFAGLPLAFDSIQVCKQKVDRLCALSLSRAKEGVMLLEDHHRIADALAEKSVSRAREEIQRHLERLDSTIYHIHKTHGEYFE